MRPFTLLLRRGQSEEDGTADSGLQIRGNYDSGNEDGESSHEHVISDILRNKHRQMIADPRTLK